MNIPIELKHIFKDTEHTPKVLIVGGTNEEQVRQQFGDQIPEEVVGGMDAATNQTKLPLHPVLVLVSQGVKDHTHVFMSFPLMNFEKILRVTPHIAETNDLRRITDWSLGFLEAFAMNNSLSVMDLLTGVREVEGMDGYDIEAVIGEVRPKREVRTLPSIGSVDDILSGQLGKEEIDALHDTKPTVITEGNAGDVIEGLLNKIKELELNKIKELENKPEETVETPPEAPAVTPPQENTALKMQQEVCDKYGYKAVQDLCKKMNMPILITKPKKAKV